ncbi:MAG: tRNA(Met) cytidine acetyltransferase [Gammaproteobacteria bacterium]|nr:tRNA(Met) cytidine acetyltransferase [Gammaproteobacteria bacterium]
MRGERRLYLLSGPEVWGRALARQMIPAAFAARRVVLGESDTPPLAQLLGREIPLLLINSHNGFDPDLVAAAAGSVAGGGVILLLTPPLALWPTLSDPLYPRISVHPEITPAPPSRYIGRLAALLGGDPRLTVVTPEQPPPTPLSIEIAPITAGASAQQQQVVAAVVRVAEGHRNRPLIVTADRGRGKSSALGMAAAALLLRGKQKVVVTAPARSAVDALFYHAAETLGVTPVNGNSLSGPQGEIRFLPPDQLLATEVALDLLLIDEAAAIPTPLLTKLLGRYRRLVFATTLHGYEGSGRGFAFRFRAILDQKSPGWRSLQLQIPIRWREGDRVEALLNDLLLLNASAARVEPPPQLSGAMAGEVELQAVDRGQLVTDRELLQQIFGLLIEAHYRTTPLDLKQLLDGPNLTLYCGRFRGAVVAVVVVAVEGEIDGPESTEILACRRRLRGHLLPQILASQHGIESALAGRFWRIIRIAIHPDLQRTGIGSRLLRQLVTKGEGCGIDLLGASFGASSPLLRFWVGNGFAPVHTGARERGVSGAHAVTLLKYLTSTGERIYTTAVANHRLQLPLQLGDALQDLEPDLALQLWQGGMTAVAQRFTPEALEQLRAFALGKRPLESVIATLFHYAGAVFALEREVPPEEQRVVMMRIVQRRSWAECCHTLGLHGRQQGLQQLRSAYARLLA